MVDQVLVTLLAGGHGLLIGVPGLAKTRLVETLGIVLGLDWKRIQFTPDLMPADIIGSEVLEEGEAAQRSFRFLQGPGLHAIADGGRNQPRVSPRTQSALLQAMQEKHVTVAGAALRPAAARSMCSRPRTRSSRKAPIRLPEAQLDRFLLQIDVGYPDIDAERRMLVATTFGEEAPAKPVCDARRADRGASTSCAICRWARKWSMRSCGSCAPRARTMAAPPISQATSPGGRVRAQARPSCWRCARRR